MSNGSYLWPGERMRAFFRAHIARETRLDAAAVEKLSEALTKHVNRMLVWDAGDADAQLPVVADPKTKAPATGFAATSVAASSEDAAAFNAFAFSAMVTLARTGRDGLMRRLTEIKKAEHLKAFAEAQHLAVDRNLKKPEELRKAIVAATEQRLADRKAAAS